MTFKELAKAENPNLEGWEILSDCPEDFGLEENSKCIGDCEKCWNREMPMTAKEVIEETISKHDDVITNVINKSHFESGYNTGLKDALEFVKKFEDLNAYELMDIYGTSSLRVILSQLTPHEAMEKLKAYEEAQIKVGDVLEYKDEKVLSIVLKVYGKEHLYLLFADGSAGVHPREGYKKTGKHIDIQSILDQIAE